MVITIWNLLEDYITLVYQTISKYKRTIISTSTTSPAQSSSTSSSSTSPFPLIPHLRAPPLEEVTSRRSIRIRRRSNLRIVDRHDTRAIVAHCTGVILWPVWFGRSAKGVHIWVERDGEGGVPIFHDQADCDVGDFWMKGQ
jgi:hypothetical protein